MLRWILDDTRALIQDLRALGRRLSMRWQWLRMRSRRRIDTAAADLENVRRGAGTRTRMCGACRALIPIDARVCPECGETPGRPVSRGMTRVLENMVPGALSVSSTLLTLNLLCYALASLVYAQLSGRGGLPPPLRSGAWSVTLLALGANEPWFVLQAGEAWRLVTMIFLHGNLIHLLMNSWALLAVGPLIEEIYGPRKLLALYLATGVCASLASLLRHLGTHGSSVGASGAIFGLIGVAAAWGWKRGGRVGEGIRGQMVQWALYGLAMGFLIPGVDNAAHVGGLIAGGLLGLLVADARPRDRWSGRLWDAATWLCVLLLLGSFVMVGLNYEGSIPISIRILVGSL